MNEQSPELDALLAADAADWSRVAERFHQEFSRLTGRMIDALLDAAGVGANSVVLDVGCGPGEAAAWAAQRGARVTGIDVAEGMVRLAARLHPGIPFVLAAVEKLPFEDGIFDAAIGNFVVLHFARPEQAAAELARVLKPGGRLALTTWDAQSESRVPWIVRDAMERAGVPPPGSASDEDSPFRFAADAEFRRLLERAGFADVSVTTLRFDYELEDPGEFWDAILNATATTGPFILGQPSNVQQRIRSEYNRLITAYSTGGHVRLPASVKLASGHRPSPKT